jgi:hypothetical protein
MLMLRPCKKNSKSSVQVERKGFTRSKQIQITKFARRVHTLKKNEKLKANVHIYHWLQVQYLVTFNVWSDF